MSLPGPKSFKERFSEYEKHDLAVFSYYKVVLLALLFELEPASMDCFRSFSPYLGEVFGSGKGFGMASFGAGCFSYCSYD